MNIVIFAEPNFKEKKLRTDFQEEKNECWKFLKIYITNIKKLYLYTCSTFIQVGKMEKKLPIRVW